MGFIELIIKSIHILLFINCVLYDPLYEQTFILNFCMHIYPTSLFVFLRLVVKHLPAHHR